MDHRQRSPRLVLLLACAGLLLFGCDSGKSAAALPTGTAAQVKPAATGAASSPPVVTREAAVPSAPVAPKTEATGRALPDEIRVFADRRDSCDHFRGEDPYDEERARFLENKIEETCKGSDAELARLRKAYNADRAVTARLADYEDRIE